MIWLCTFASAATPLTHDAVLSAAIQSNPSLRRARLDALSAEADVRTSQGFLDPTLTADANLRRNQQKGFFQGFPFSSTSEFWDVGVGVNQTLATGTSYDLDVGLNRNTSVFITDFGVVGSDERRQDAFTSNVDVSLTQQLLKGLRLSYNLQNVTRARNAASRAELQLQSARQQALADASTAYWNWVYQMELQSLAVESLVVAEEALRVGLLKLEMGQIAPVEGTRLQAARVQAEQNLLDAQISAAKSAADLGNLLGQAAEDWEPSVTSTEVRLDAVDPDAAVRVALAQNVDLMLARASVELAEIERLNARHAVLPSLAATVTAGIGNQDASAGNAVSGLFRDEAFPYVGVGGNFAMPLGNRAARGEREATSIALEVQQQALADLERSIQIQVEQQVRILTASAKRIDLVNANAALARETLAAEEALAEAGRSIQKTVLEARAEVDRTAVEVAKAQSDYRIAQSELLRLQGQLGDQN